MLDILNLEIPDWFLSLSLVLITILLAGTILKHRSYYGVALLLLVARAAALSAAQSYQNNKDLIHALNNDVLRMVLYLVCIYMLILDLTQHNQQEAEMFALRRENHELKKLKAVLARHEAALCNLQAQTQLDLGLEEIPDLALDPDPDPEADQDGGGAYSNKLLLQKEGFTDNV